MTVQYATASGPARSRTDLDGGDVDALAALPSERFCRFWTRPIRRCCGWVRVVCVWISGEPVGGPFDRLVQCHVLVEVSAEGSAPHERPPRTRSGDVRPGIAPTREALPSRTAARAGTRRCLGRLADEPACLRRRGARVPPRQGDARLAIVCNPDLRPTGSRECWLTSSGAPLAAPTNRRRWRSKRTGDGLLDVGLELPVAWVESLIPYVLPKTAAAPQSALPTSFRRGC